MHEELRAKLTVSDCTCTNCRAVDQIALKKQPGTFCGAITSLPAKWLQKFCTDDVSLLKSGLDFWLVGRGTTNQKHYPDLDSDTSSAWNFCGRSSDVISRGNQVWRREISVGCFLRLWTRLFTIDLDCRHERVISEWRKPIDNTRFPGLGNAEGVYWV